MRYTQATGLLLPDLQTTVSRLLTGFEVIPPHRKELLRDLSKFIDNGIKQGKGARLNFVCTHNSRRSQISQLWAQASAYYFGIPGIECFSGGTEATEFDIRAVEAMRAVGFRIDLANSGEGNSRYEVHFAQNANPLIAFSKRYDDPYSPVADFAAVMTCSHADENCPVIPGAAARFAVMYDDPKAFDNTLQEKTKYRECVDRIGREILYAFSLVAGHVEIQ